MDREREKRLIKLQKGEKCIRGITLAGLLATILSGLLGGIAPLTACITGGLVLGVFLIAAGILSMRISALLPPPENPKRDPIVNQAMSVLFGLLILALCIFVLIQALK